MNHRRLAQLSPLDTSVTTNSSKTSEEVQDVSSYSAGSTKHFSMHIAINEYSKRMDDELDMRPGDKIQVITDDEEYNDGWYYGRNLRTKEEGLYPVVFTQEISMSKPHLTRAKSAKRIVSPFAKDNSSTVSNFSPMDSNSELPTPQPIETAAPVSINNRQSADRTVLVKSTMSDIDKALAELGHETLDEDNKSGHRIPDLTHDTILSSTTGLDVVNPLDRMPSGGTVKSTIENQNASSTINGIQKTDLNPAFADHWSPEEVTAYFIMLGFDVQSASRFQQHKISGAILLELELSHLKELDIDSFGTRFEIFKEIEVIKEAVNINKSGGRSDANVSAAASKSRSKSGQLMPPAFVDQTPSYRGHVRKVSRSLDDLPSQNISTPPAQAITMTSRTSSTTKRRPASLMLDANSPSNITESHTINTETNNNRLKVPTAVVDIAADENSFISPRRAPKPPSYPSPVQPPSSGTFSRTKYTPSPRSNRPGYMVSPGTIQENPYSHDNRTRDSRFKFPTSGNSGTPDDTHRRNSHMSPSSQNITSTRNSRNSQAGHKKSKSGGSFVDLFNRVSMLSPNSEKEKLNSPVEEVYHERSSSSVYAGHSRTASVVQNKAINEPQNTSELKKHRRNSSMLSFFSAKNGDGVLSPQKNAGQNKYHSRNNSFSFSPYKGSYETETPKAGKSSSKDGSKRRSVSAKDPSPSAYDETTRAIMEEEEKKKRSVSEAVKGKNVRKVQPKTMSKKQTTAFTEGLRAINVKDAMKDADCSGWLSKKGTGAMGVWKTRFFTLHGTRLSYFASTTDTRERGLIDITAHRVVPAKEDDKLVSLYAASTGRGRYCFKLVPPQPGSKKGLTFTQPRVHYFAVDSKEDMRAWMAALIKTNIDIDTTVPIISSYSTPTVSLSKAQEMLSQAREETRMKETDENEGEILWDQQNNVKNEDRTPEKAQNEKTLDPTVPATDTRDNTMNTSDGDTSTFNISTTNTTAVSSSGFASPYLLASGVLTPSMVRTNSMRLRDGRHDSHDEAKNTSEKI